MGLIVVEQPSQQTHQILAVGDHLVPADCQVGAGGQGGCEAGGGGHKGLRGNRYVMTSL